MVIALDIESKHVSQLGSMRTTRLLKATNVALKDEERRVGKGESPATKQPRVVQKKANGVCHKNMLLRANSILVALLVYKRHS